MTVRQPTWARRFDERIEQGLPLAATVYQWHWAEQILGRSTELGLADVDEVVPRLGDLSYKALRDVLVLLTKNAHEQAGLAPGDDFGDRWERFRARVAAGDAVAGAWQTRLERLAALRARIDQIRPVPSGELLSDTDQERFAAAQPLFERLLLAMARGDSAQASPALIEELQQILEGYRRLLHTAPAPPTIASLFGEMIANALYALGRTHAALGQLPEAQGRFTEAMGAYEAVGNVGNARSSRERVQELILRQSANLDDAVERFQAVLALIPGPTLQTAGVRVKLAQVSLVAGDVAAGTSWLAGATADLRALNYADPGGRDLDSVVGKWISAVPELNPEPPNFFIATLTDVVTLYLAIYGVQLDLAGRGQAVDTSADLAQMERLRRLPPLFAERAEAVARRIDAAAAPLGIAPVQPDAASQAALDQANRTGWAAIDQAAELARRLEALKGESDRRAAAKEPQDDLLADVRTLEEQSHSLNDGLWSAMATKCRADILMAMSQANEAVAALAEARQELSAQDSRHRAFDVALLSQSALASAGLGRWDDVSRASGEAIDLVEADRGKVNAPFLQAAYLRDRGLVYTIGVFSAFKLQDFPTMLERAERSKAAATLHYSQANDGPDQNLSELLGAFRSVSDRVDQKRRGAPEVTEPLDELLARRSGLWDRLMIQRLDARNEGSERRDGSTRFSLAAVQEALGSDTAVIYYYWLSATVVLIVTLNGDDLAVERRILSAARAAELGETIEQIKLVEGFVDFDAVIPQWTELMPQEGGPLLHGKARLILSPHRLLHQFPLHALFWEGEPLATRFAVSYVPNLSALLVDRPAAPRPRTLALGIREFSRSVGGTRSVDTDAGRADLGPLAKAEEEAEAVQRIYEVHSGATELLTGARATKAKLRQWAEDGTLASLSCLHFCTHGSNASPDENQPMESYLWLRQAPPGLGSPAEESEVLVERLEAIEIASWSLNANLVVLSSCYSGKRAAGGRGMPEWPGDDLFGLQAAFFMAGASNVVGSLWTVADEAAYQVMTDLHRLVAQGIAPDLALQRAVKRLARRDGLTAMYYWAPFFLTRLGRESHQTADPSGRWDDPPHEGR